MHTLSPRKRSSALLFLTAVLLATVGVACYATDLLFFHENGCPHCAHVHSLLDEMLPEYPEIVLHEYEIHDEASFDLLNRVLAAYDVEIGAVPMLFVGNVAVIEGVFHGLRDEPLAASGRAEELALRESIELAIAEPSPSPLDRADSVEEVSGLAETLTIPAVILAAAADSVNPCTFAVLVLLLGTLIVAGRKGKTLQIGAAFIVAIYVSYFLMGIGIFSAIQSAGVQRPFIMAVSSLAILLGLWNMKDYFAYGKWFTVEVPKRWRPMVKRLTASVVSVPGAFLVGILDSLFLLPCSSGPYIAILALLSKTTSRTEGILYLLLYNLIFVLPLIGIMLAVHFGYTTTARAERWRSARLGKLHLVTGAIMFLLGVGMLVAVQVGWM